MAFIAPGVPAVGPVSCEQLDPRYVSDKLDEAMNEAVGETFRELIQVRTEIAEEAGYDSYIDYAYSCYNRDYRPKDV